ncbi:MAG: RelA/SpoT family protein [Bacteroidales bacterium]|nr:RelA/SpoT family protein [Bacteroidales bacterium]
MSFSEFSQDDLNLIARERDALFELAGARCRDDRELETVKKAFEFANEAHLNVRRRSGEPFIIHPVKVAEIVVEEVGLGFKSICAALLHDVVEDTEYSADDIRNLFGDKIGALVDGLTKIKTVLNNEEQKGGAVISESLQAENFKRILLTMNDDVRVVLIKLCDRLHNCRTIEYLPEHKRDRVLSETMFIFIPLAHRLGLYEIKSEMENIWLKYKEPDEYNAISRKINTDVDVRNHEIDEFISPIRDALLEYGYKFEIRKRIKTPYSIWYKIHNKQVPFEQIYDLYAVRIIFDPAEETMQAERSQAYLIYSVVTNLYRENLSRRRDWISQPKSNGYEALHCTLMSHVGVWIEVQIRSRRMNDIAEKGIAAHWAYKNDGYITENDSEMDKWLAEVQDILGSKDVGDMEILDLIHSDLVSSEIVVFTPKGEQKSIKYGSTALDFAYMIHSHIGEKAIAAKVNMKLVPLSHVLKSGDQVEIITAESAKPKIECLQFLTTRYAKSRVIDYFRKDYDVISSNGEKIFMERMKAMGVSAGNDILKKFINYSKINDLGELYFRVGLGILGPEEFRTILTEDALQLPVGASDKLEYVMADCCNPIPGDSIVGFMSGENTIIVHKKTCPVAENLASKFGNRVVVPQWMLLTKEYPIRLSLRGIDRVGILSDISFFISGSQGSNIRKIQLSTEEGLFDGYIELLVRDKKNLDSMVAGLKKIDGIQDVVRTDI